MSYNKIETQFNETREAIHEQNEVKEKEIIEKNKYFC